MAVDRVGGKQRKARVSVRREAILRAALREFAARGFEGARVDRVARSARVNKALLYYHFGNKAALYEAVLTRWMEFLLGALRERVSPRPGPEEKLAALAAAFEDLVKRHPEYPQILVREFSSGGRNLTPKVLKRLLELLEFEGAILEEGRRDGVFRAASPLTVHLLLVVGTVLHLMGRKLMERSAKLGLHSFPPLPESPSGAVLGLLLDGLRADAGRRKGGLRSRGKPGGRGGEGAPGFGKTRRKEEAR